MMNRREALRSVAGAYLAVGRSKPLFAFRRSEPEMQFPAAGKDRLAVTSYPFRTRLVSPLNRDRDASVPGMDMKQFPEFVKETFGVSNINPLVNHFASTDAEYLDAFRQAVEKAGSHVVDLGLPGGRFYAVDAAVRQSAIDSACQRVDIAAKIGSPSVRQHVGGHPGERPNIVLASESLGRVADYGGKRNVAVLLENDSPVAEDPFFLVAVVEKANNAFLRTLPDFGNSLMGHDREYNERAVKAMLGHAYNMCHVKDFVETDSGQKYTVDLGSLFALAKASSYRGFYSMEFETKGGDAVVGTKRLIEESLKYLA